MCFLTVKRSEMFSHSKDLVCSQQKAKQSVDLSSLPIKSHGEEKEEKRRDLEKRESLTPEKRQVARNPAGFSNLSNLKARRRKRPKKKQEPGEFRITMKKLQDLEISKCQTKAIGREEVRCC